VVRRRTTRASAAVTLVAVAALVAGCGAGDEPETEAPLPPTGVPDLLWSGDFETGDLSQYEDTPWNTHGGARPPEVVSDPALVRDGRYALAVTIPGVSDGEGITEDSRNEVEPQIHDISEGDELWFGFSTRLGEDFPVDEGWQIVTQWKNAGEGSPPVELGIEDGSWHVSGGAGHPDDADPFSETLAPAERGVWSDWVFRIKFSTDPAVGEIEVWRNGELVLPTYRPESGTMYPPGEGEDVPDEPSSYVKTGYYRAADIAAPGTIYFDDWRIGTSAAAVERAA
jgi:hypothetical protein